MKHLLFIVLIFATVALQAQNAELLQVIEYELSGEWIGKLTQEKQNQILAPEYRFDVQLEVKGRNIEGWSYIEVDGNHAKIKLKGYRNGLKVELTELQITESSIKENYMWCIKNMHLEFGYENGKYRLSGKWDGKSSRGQCSPGTIELRKETIRA